MDKSIITTQVITLALLMGVGFFARKRRLLTPAVNKGLTELLLNITAPFLAVASFQFAYSREMLTNAGMILLFGVAVHLFAIGFGKLLYAGIPNDTGKVLRFTTIFSNCGFMGYPIIGGFFGSQGIFYTSIYVAVFIFFIWTYGIIIFTGKTERRSLMNALINPGVLAVCAGMIIFLFSIKLPVPIAKTMEMVGSMTTPISMIIVGSMLADLEWKDLFSGWPIYYGAIIRLAVMPLLVWSILKWLGVHGIVLGVCVLAVAMPAAAMSVPLAEKNEGDVSFASRIVFLTTILSIFTIPMMVLLI